MAMILGVINVRSKGGGCKFFRGGRVVRWFYCFNNRLVVFVCVFYSACLPIDMITAIGCKEVGIQIAQQNILSHYRSPII